MFCRTCISIGPGNHYLVGGLPTVPWRIGPYMRSQDCVAEAQAFEQGASLATVGPWLTLAGSLLLVGVVVGELVSPPRRTGPSRRSLEA